MAIEFDVDINIFNKVYRPFIDDDTFTQIFYGGSSSGKSFFLAQRCVYDMLQGGHNYLCIRKVARYIRKSIFNEITKAISAFNANKFFKVNSSDMVITCVNGYQIMFVGMDDTEKVKSITPTKGVITDCWVEEATEATYDDIAQLRKRLRGRARVAKRLILSFNPVYKTHWIYGEYFAGKWRDNDTSYRDDRLSITKTTYKDNEFLADEDIMELEGEKNPYYKDVYTFGNWGVLGDVIFNNWHTEDLSRDGPNGRLVATFDQFNNGVDFGLTKQVTSSVTMSIKSGERKHLRCAA